MSSSVTGAAEKTTLFNSPYNRAFLPLEHDGESYLEIDGTSSVDKEKSRNAKLLKAAQGFEAIFVRQLMKTMRTSLPGEGIFGKGSAGEIYGDMMDNAVAEVISKRGSLGIADVIYRQLVHEDELRTEKNPQENTVIADI